MYGPLTLPVLNASVNGFVNVTSAPYNATGNGTTNDTAAIQSAINSVCSTAPTPAKYGGTVYFPPGNYKTTSTLYIGTGCHLKGAAGGGFPYFGTPSSIAIINPVFSNPNSWVIDTAVYVSGAALAYNDFTSAPTYIYQDSIEDLNINSGSQSSTPIFGGIRFAGNPGSLIRNVSIQGNDIGIGVDLDYSFETKLDNVHATSNYFGLLVINNSNADTVVASSFDEVYTPSQLTVPTAVLNALFGSNFPTYLSNVGLDAAHATTAKGVVFIGPENAGSYSIEAQNWPDALFVLGTGIAPVGSMEFPYFYSEGNTYPGAGAMFSFYTGAYTQVNIDSINDYGVEYAVDSGNGDLLKVNMDGNFAANLFDNVSTISASLTLRDVTPSGSYPNIVNFENIPGGGNSFAAATKIGNSAIPVSSGTATAGALACIKSAGPPPVIGTCTAVSGASCTTCN
jgi:hypothetical protein